MKLADQLKNIQLQLTALENKLDKLPTWINFEGLLLSDVVSNLLNQRFYRGIMAARDKRFDEYVEECIEANKQLNSRIKKSLKIEVKKQKRAASRKVRTK